MNFISVHVQSTNFFHAILGCIKMVLTTHCGATINNVKWCGANRNVIGSVVPKFCPRQLVNLLLGLFVVDAP